MKKLFAIALLLLLQNIAFSCTTFFINQNGQMVFGRNYDWVTGVGMVCTNLKGLYKTSMKTQDGNTISWTSQYGSITFNQYGKEFPTGGMNEKGLVVELMWLEETKYPAPDTRPSVGVLQWIQYQLDNCATLEDVIATDSKIRIASKGTAPIHYLIADANGHAATIEFLDGKMVAHYGNELPLAVLTNNNYKESLELTQNESDHDYANNSIDRFAKACEMVKKLDPTNFAGSLIDYSFNILDKVSQGSFTQWSIVYDITNKTVYFKTHRYPDQKELSLAGVDFNCSSQSYFLNMNQEMKGNVRSEFLPFSIQLNRDIIEKAIEESSSRIHINELEKRQEIDYPGTIKCIPNLP